MLKQILTDTENTRQRGRLSNFMNYSTDFSTRQKKPFNFKIDQT